MSILKKFLALPKRLQIELLFYPLRLNTTRNDWMEVPAVVRFVGLAKRKISSRMTVREQS